MDGTEFDYSRTADQTETGSSGICWPIQNKDSFDCRFYQAMQDFVHTQNWMPVPQNQREVRAAMAVLEERLAFYVGKPAPPPIRFGSEERERPVASPQRYPLPASKSDDDIRASLRRTSKLVPSPDGRVRAKIDRRRHVDRRSLEIHVEVLIELLTQFPGPSESTLAIDDELAQCQLHKGSKVFAIIPDLLLGKSDLELLINVACDVLSNWPETRCNKPR